MYNGSISCGGCAKGRNCGLLDGFKLVSPSDSFFTVKPAAGHGDFIEGILWKQIAFKLASPYQLLIFWKPGSQPPKSAFTCMHSSYGQRQQSWGILSLSESNNSHVTVVARSESTYIFAKSFHADEGSYGMSRPTLAPHLFFMFCPIAVECASDRVIQIKGDSGLWNGV